MIGTYLRRKFCSHEVYIEELRRLSDHQVVAKCNLCGKALAATYGLALPAKLLQRPKDGIAATIKEASQP